MMPAPWLSSTGAVVMLAARHCVRRDSCWASSGGLGCSGTPTCGGPNAPLAGSARLSSLATRAALGAQIAMCLTMTVMLVAMYR
jgi:hypothetical protein